MLITFWWQIFVPCIHGLVSREVVRAVTNFLEFVYLARSKSHSDDTIEEMENYWRAYVRGRDVFEPVHPNGFNAPRLHAPWHYPALVRFFGSAVGYDSSVLTEHLHIPHIKAPYRRSNKNHPTLQILTSNTREDKMKAMETFLKASGGLQDEVREEEAKRAKQGHLRAGIELAKKPGNV